MLLLFMHALDSFVTVKLFEDYSPTLNPFFFLAIVADGLDKKQRDLERKRIEEMVKKTALRIDVRVYDFNTLKRKYGISTSDA